MSTRLHSISTPPASCRNVFRASPAIPLHAGSDGRAFAQGVNAALPGVVSEYKGAVGSQAGNEVLVRTVRQAGMRPLAGVAFGFCSLPDADAQPPVQCARYVMQWSALPPWSVLADARPGTVKAKSGVFSHFRTEQPAKALLCPGG